MKCNSFLLSFFILFVLNLSVKAQSGTNDPTFNPTDVGFGFGDGANGAIMTTALQSDGKIIICGSFTFYNGIPMKGIARINADGTLDKAFNPGSGVEGQVNTIVLQPDGKIIIGGYFYSYNWIPNNSIVRLNSDGTLDTSFKFNFSSPNSTYSIALQLDGKIIIGGNFKVYNGGATDHIARLNSDGTIDPTFNPSTGLNNSVRTILQQPDGKIIIGGDFELYNWTNRNKIARLNCDGTLDATFDPGAGADNTVRTTTIQPDGKIIIAGNFTTYDRIARNGVARINTDGTLDNTYNPAIGANSIVYTSVLQDDNKVIIGGVFTLNNSTKRNSSVRINEDGTLDSSFNPGTSGSVYSSLIQPDGKIIFGGSLVSYNGRIVDGIARINTNGMVDKTFKPASGANNIVCTMALQKDEKIIIGGIFTSYNGATRNRIARLNNDGTLDDTFDPDAGANGGVFIAVLQSDSKIIIGGQFTSYNGTPINRIARLNSDGTLDNSFKPGTGVDMGVNTIVVQPDGKIIIGGSFTSYNGTSRNSIARLKADGTLDDTFNNCLGSYGSVSTIVLQKDGKIIIGGNFTSCGGTIRNRIARLNYDGTLDVTFDPVAGANSSVRSAFLQPDGKIIVGGVFTSYNGSSRNHIARLNTDGTLDAAFNPGVGANSDVNTIAIQTDAKIIIGGFFTSYNGVPRNCIARINIDGTLDESFNPGLGTNNIYGSVSCLYFSVICANGNLIIGGDFTSYNGVGRNRIARILNSISNGTSTLKSKAISVYPNPVSDELNIEIDGNKELLNYEIVNTTGQTVFKGSLVEKASVQTSSFAPGIYLIKLGNDNVYELKKIIKE